jgi:chromosome condensin MukBEF MukE localization factor
MKIRTIEPIQHDGELIEPGSIGDVSERAAQQLIEAGAAEAVDAENEQDSAENEQDSAENEQDSAENEQDSADQPDA